VIGRMFCAWRVSWLPIASTVNSSVVVPRCERATPSAAIGSIGLYPECTVLP
jgi:hypothetical protein